MVPLKEFAHFVTLNSADLAETYVQLLHKAGQGYDQVSVDSCRASARQLLQAVIEACQTETFNPLSQLFDPDKYDSQRQAGIHIFPRQSFIEIECLGRTLTPVVTSLEAGKFLWQMLAEVRAVVLAASEDLPAISGVSSPPESDSEAHLKEQAWQIEPPLQDSLDRFGGAFEYAANGMMIVAKDGRFLLVNEALCRLLGYSKQELLSLNFQAITYPDDLTRNVDQLRQLLAGEVDSFQQEKRYVHKLGQVVWVQINVAAVRDGRGEVLYFVTQVYDITQRRQTEEMLQRLRLAVEQSLEGLAIADLNGIIQFVNPAWAAMHGYRVEELVGQPLSLFHTPEQLRTEVEEFNARVLVKGLQRGEMEHKRKDGTTFPTWMSVTQIKDDSHKPIGLLAACQDITDRKRVEEVLAKRANELQAVTRISTALSSILDSERLLQETVDLTKSGFDLYHAHLYLLDETGQDLALAAGAGEVGRKMAAQRWRIPLAHQHSLVARAARRRQAVVSNDARAEPDFLPNPDLPGTRSEMAVPLIAGETLLGVLDVQSDQAGWFTEEDVRIYTTLASQAATAIHNAHLFAQTQSALASLRESQSLLRSIIDATPDWIFIKDQEHRYRLVNQGYATALHLSPEDFLGKNDLELGFPEELVKGNPEKGIRGFWADDRLVMESGQQQVYPNDPATIDGQVHVFHTIKTPLRDAEDKVWGVLAFARDITEREQVLREMQQSQQLLRSVIDATPDWIFIKDQEHRFRLVNQGYAKSLHLSFEEIIGKTDLELGMPEDIVKGNPEKGIRGFWPDDREVMDTGQSKFVASEPAVVDGQPVWLSTIKVPLRDAEGKVWAVLGYVRDITEREKLLAEMQRSQAEAEARLRETQILQQLARELSGTLEASEVINAFFTASQELLGADYAIFSLVDPHQKRIGAVAGFNVSADHIRRANHALDSSDIMADIIRTGQTEIITGWDARFDSENFEAEGMAEWGMRIFSPITLRHENVGMVEVGFKEKGEVNFQQAQVRLIRSLVDQTAIALESAQRYEASQRVARRERNIREITEKMRAAISLEQLIKTATTELGERLLAGHVVVELGLEPAGSRAGEDNGHGH